MRVGGPSSAGFVPGQHAPGRTPTPAEAQLNAEKDSREGERSLLVREGDSRSYDVRNHISQFTDQVRYDAISYNAQAKITNDGSAQRRQSFGNASEQYAKGGIIDVYI